jgi:hypothetical protein
MHAQDDDTMHCDIDDMRNRLAPAQGLQLRADAGRPYAYGYYASCMIKQGEVYH